MIDFSNCVINKYKYYGGQNGNKICIKYNGKDYMLKFPSFNDNKESYTNSCILEYITCHILETIGLNVQKTILGIYKKTWKKE